MKGDGGSQHTPMSIDPSGSTKRPGCISGEKNDTLSSTPAAKSTSVLPAPETPQIKPQKVTPEGPQGIVNLIYGVETHLGDREEAAFTKRETLLPSVGTSTLNCKATDDLPMPETTPTRSSNAPRKTLKCSKRSTTATFTTKKSAKAGLSLTSSGIPTDKASFVFSSASERWPPRTQPSTAEFKLLALDKIKKKPRLTGEATSVDVVASKEGLISTTEHTFSAVDSHAEFSERSQKMKNAKYIFQFDIPREVSVSNLSLSRQTSSTVTVNKVEALHSSPITTSLDSQQQTPTYSKLFQKHIDMLSKNTTEEESLLPKEDNHMMSNPNGPNPPPRMTEDFASSNTVKLDISNTENYDGTGYPSTDQANVQAVEVSSKVEMGIKQSPEGPNADLQAPSIGKGISTLYELDTKGFPPNTPAPETSNSPPTTPPRSPRRAQEDFAYLKANRVPRGLPTPETNTSFGYALVTPTKRYSVLLPTRSRPDLLLYTPPQTPEGSHGRASTDEPSVERIKGTNAFLKFPIPEDAKEKNVCWCGGEPTMTQGVNVGVQTDPLPTEIKKTRFVTGFKLERLRDDIMTRFKTGMTQRETVKAEKNSCVSDAAR
jgi:hypothetical protein